MQCPAVLVSASASGQGKTLVTAAIARTWRNRGLKVQAFKCGPDFIDSMLLQAATGNPVYNLDLGMCGLVDGKAQLYRAAQHADVIILEGVMGLYDGTPSTADIAKAFNIPVALTIDASGMAQTFAAVTHGLFNFDNTVPKAGVVANKVGSSGHAAMLETSLPDDTPWLGALVKDEQFTLPERHLGLYLADEITNLDSKIDAASKALLESSEVALPPNVSFAEPAKGVTPKRLNGKTIAIARDAAFCFIYPANIDCLLALGATLVYFSLLNDEALPEADAYWIPGGYPELHLDAIKKNTGMRASLQEVANNAKPILAECGGMMVLGQSLNGSATFGLLEGNSEIQAKLQGLGTQDIESNDEKISAHTFHYGKFDTPMQPSITASSQYKTGESVYRHHNITASFLHFYFPSNPLLTAQFFTS